MIDCTRELHQRETLIPILGNWKGGITSGFLLWSDYYQNQRTIIEKEKEN